MVQKFLFVALLLSTFNCFATESALDAATKITGKYAGEWTMFGLENGVVVQQAKWNDVLIAETPTQGNGLAFVNVTDNMIFADGTNRISKFQEGYFSNVDGSVGDRFYEIMGNKVLFKRLSESDWSFQATPSAWELSSLGFNPKNVVFASHVTTKTTTYDGLIDTDHVTRITTIQWKDSEEGIPKSLQFVSLSGYHTRVK